MNKLKRLRQLIMLKLLRKIKNFIVDDLPRRYKLAKMFYHVKRIRVEWLGVWTGYLYTNSESDNWTYSMYRFEDYHKMLFDVVMGAYHYSAKQILS